MTINNTKLRLPPGKFFTEEHKKDLIVLHFTAGGNASSVIPTWMSQNIQIGTPYVLDTDGIAYEIFDPKYWAYHLGITGPAAQNHLHDKRSVPIEVVNFGPLKCMGDDLYSWPNNYKNFFCHLSETDKYVKTSFRGFDYFAAFPEVQKTALVELVKKISIDFNIPLTLPPIEKRGVFDTTFFGKWIGVASHQNFRPDKFDIGPAWDWSLLGS